MIFQSQQIRIDPAYQSTLAQAGLVDVDQILNCLGDRVVAWSRTTDTVYVRGRDGKPGFFVKRYFYRGWRKRYRGMFRGTFFGQHRGQAEARSLDAMRRRGIPAVRPVAWGARRSGHFVTASFLITEEAPDAENLTSFATAVRENRDCLNRRQRVVLCERLAEHVAAMHAAGFVHGQLYWRNILVRMGVSEEPEFFFLDARPLVRYTGMSRVTNWRQVELSQLAASAMPFTTRADRLRFARHYLGSKRLTRQQKRELREAGDRTEKYARHETQRIAMNRLFDEWNLELEREIARENAVSVLARDLSRPADIAGPVDLARAPVRLSAGPH